MIDRVIDYFKNCSDLSTIKFASKIGTHGMKHEPNLHEPGDGKVAWALGGQTGVLLLRSTVCRAVHDNGNKNGERKNKG